MKLYKHPRSSDVAMAVLGIRYNKRYKLDDPKNLIIVRVRWMNVVNSNNIFDMSVSEELVMTIEKFKEFEIYE